MKTDLQWVSTTASFSTCWVENDVLPTRSNPMETNLALSEDVVIVQGKYANMLHGTFVIVTVQPSIVDRKLAIREINGRLAGKTPRSNTVVCK